MSNLGIIGVLIGVTLILYAVISEIMRFWKQRAHIRHCGSVLETNALRLKRWKNVRPFVKTGYCGYARALIFQMIDAVENLLTYKPHCVEFKTLLSTLYKKLAEFPSPNGPLPSGPFICIKA